MILHKTKGDRIFSLINGLVMVLLCFTTLYPFLYLLSLSFTPTTVSQLTFDSLIPKEFSLSNYARVFENDNFGQAFLVTIFRTVIGTFSQVFCTMLVAYPLSKRYFPHRSFWTLFVVIPMFFSGGLIPTYLQIKNLGLINRFLVYIVPGLINSSNLLIIRNNFMAFPEELEESAKIDGANEFKIFVRILIPLSMPVIATIGLWTAVAHWNSWYDNMIYVSNPDLMVLQQLLRKIIIEGTTAYMNTASDSATQVFTNPESVKAATTIVATLPILLVYPFLQKYFMKGIMIGSLKG
ncbi:MAG TPA: carbohydrate ABC transporter permease [Candidatus Merdivicinus faecavium]|nr:carbohydrate ABC transporter permease [Candidatus Merdivicinus faecavium]